MGRKQRFNSHRWCNCQSRVSSFSFYYYTVSELKSKLCYWWVRLCFFEYAKAKYSLFKYDCSRSNIYIYFKLISKMWILILNNLQRNLLGHQGQSATSQLFWLTDPSLNNSCWVFPWRGDLCAFQELAPNGTQTFSHLITVIKSVIKWC